MWTTWSPPQGREQDGEGWRLGLQGQAEDPQQTLFFLHPDVLVYFLLFYFYIYIPCVWFSHLKLFLPIIKRGITTKKYIK